jgi:hypothetical protein
VPCHPRLVWCKILFQMYSSRATMDQFEILINFQIDTITHVVRVPVSIFTIKSKRPNGNKAKATTNRSKCCDKPSHALLGEEKFMTQSVAPYSWCIDHTQCGERYQITDLGHHHHHRPQCPQQSLVKRSTHEIQNETKTS